MLKKGLALIAINSGNRLGRGLGLRGIGLQITRLYARVCLLVHRVGSVMEVNNSKQQADGSRPSLSNECDGPNPPVNKRRKSGDVTSNLKERKEEDHHSTEQCQKVFKTYYARLCNIPVEEVMPHLVSNDVITIREMEEILVEKTSLRQAQALLNGPIYRAIKVGYPKPFITFLYVLHSIHGCKMLCEEICTDLDISTEVLSSESREFKYSYLYI